VVINTTPLITMNETAHLPLRKVPNDFLVNRRRATRHSRELPGKAGWGGRDTALNSTNVSGDVVIAGVLAADARSGDRND
jgi:hypothetical protein